MPETPDDRPVYLMDASAFIHRAFHAMSSFATKDGRPTGAAFGFTMTLLKLIREKRPELIAIVYDSRHEKRRHEIYPEYKANRKPMDPALAAQQEPIREIVAGLGLPSIQREGFEADDIIASMCRLAESEGHPVVIVSGDKDFYQLLSPKVSMFDPAPKKSAALNLDSFRERFRLEHSAFLEVQGLMGDSTDNIPGIPGVGEVTALKLITAFGTIDNLYKNIDKVSSPKLREKIRRHESSARLSKSLAALVEGLEPPVKIWDLALREPDLPALRKIMSSLEFGRLLNDVESLAKGSSEAASNERTPNGSSSMEAGVSHWEGSQAKEAEKPEEPPWALPPGPNPLSPKTPLETAQKTGIRLVPAPAAASKPDGADLGSHAPLMPSKTINKTPKRSAKSNNLLEALMEARGGGPKTAGLTSLFDKGDQSGVLEPVAPRADDVVDYDAYVLVDGEEGWKKLLEALEKSERLAVDLETDGPKPSQASIVGISLATGPEGEAFYIPVAHETPGAPNQPWELVSERIGPYLTKASPPKVGQHAKFDWQILSRYGLILPPPSDDPMLASYLLNPDNRHGLDSISLRELGHEAISFKSVVPNPKKTFASVSPLDACRYSSEDADLTLRLAAVLRMRLSKDRELERLYDEVELPLEELLGRMEGTGVLVDPETLKRLSGDLGSLMNVRAANIYSIIGHELNLASPKQLSDALFVEMGLPSGKKTAKGLMFSTDNEVLTDLALLYPVASEIIAWRELSKLKSTYADKLPEAINPLTGRVHTSFNQALTATGRLSSSDPNLQNIPAKSEEGRRVREAFKAPEGCKLVSADYSQIELRVMAHFSGDEAMRKAFLDDEDIHAQTASKIFGIPLPEVPAERRREAKTINFGIIYGQGPYGLAKQLGIPQLKAKEIISGYFHRFPGVMEYMEKTRRKAERTGLVRTWFGRLRRLPLINSSGPSKREAERMAVNTPIQGTAADLIKMAMLMVDGELRKENLKSRIILQVHDELVLEAPAEELEKVKAILKNRMEAAGREPLAGGRPLTVPLKVDVAEGDAWVHA